MHHEQHPPGAHGAERLRESRQVERCMQHQNAPGVQSAMAILGKAIWGPRKGIPEKITSKLSLKERTDIKDLNSELFHEITA